MQINYKTIDECNKEFRLIEGAYPIEYFNDCKWIWTAQEFSGVTSNIISVTIGFLSEIENVLYYNDIKMDIKTNCFCVFKIPVVGKNIFSVKLEHPFYADNDDRELGIKIISIQADELVIL